MFFLIQLPELVSQPTLLLILRRRTLQMNSYCFMVQTDVVCWLRTGIESVFVVFHSVIYVV